MSSKTKIVVLRMKEIIYTAIFIGLGILLVTLFMFMFRPKKEAAPTMAESVSYLPGVYTASLVLGSQNVNIEVAVDADHINSITLQPLSDSVTTMYPLMAPAVSRLAAQICETQSLENITYTDGAQYTSNALMGAIKSALHKAEIPADDLPAA